MPSSARRRRSTRPWPTRAPRCLTTPTASPRLSRIGDAVRTEPALDPLRDRPDFRLLMMDLATPAEPFASPTPAP